LDSFKERFVSAASAKKAEAKEREAEEESQQATEAKH